MKKPSQLHVLLAVGGILTSTTAFAAGDYFGHRSAVILEVRAVEAKLLVVVASSVEWLELKVFKKWLADGNHPTPEKCAEMKQLAKRLGDTPPRC